MISSDPVGVCFCDDDLDTINCSVRRKTYKSFPGSTISFSVIAVGNNNGATLALIKVVGNKDLTINKTLITCTVMSYYVRVENSSVIRDTAYVTALSSSALSNVLEIDIIVLPCPRGYEFSQTTGVCECKALISDYADCFDSDLLVERSGSVWIGFDDTLNCTLVNSRCPFDYCQFSEVNISVIQPDAQCAFDRAGRLCGSCAENKSLVFGSNACRDCHENAHILVLFLFILAGIALVSFLFLFNLTVSAGTINGLIFFANVFRIYEPLFVVNKLPVLNQFISWINLDLGIETCFYHKMNACGKHGFQFIFPVYLWFIILAIIFASRYSNKVAKLVGNNGVPVLATLLHLSFTKLLRTVIFVFSVSYIRCDNDVLHFWYIDPTQKYLTGCHLPLFIVSVFVLLFLIIPYTLFFFVYPLLEASSARCRQRLSWFMIRLKPFFDAYRGPHTDLFCFWPGFLLIIRIMFALTVVIAGNESIPFSFLLLVSLVLISILSFGKVYSDRNYLHSLDIMFLLGLIFLSALFDQGECRNFVPTHLQKYGTVFVILFGIISFIVILVYHSLKLSPLKGWCINAGVKWKRRKKVSKRNEQSRDSVSSQNQIISQTSDKLTSIDVPIVKTMPANFSKYRESLFSIQSPEER